MNIRELLIKIGVDAGDSTRELDRIDRQTDKVKRGFQSLNGVLTALFAGGAIKSILGTADAMQDLQSRIGSATGDLSGANAQLNDLAKHANDNRMSVDAYADSWAKFETGMVRMGKTSDDTTDLVDGLSAAFRVNGTAAATSQGALFQLTQSISGGTVQMEELNSLMDAQGNLYVSVAEDIGGTTTAFKKMVSQGKVTSKMLAESLIKNTRKYITQLREMPRTLGDVWTVVSNDVKMAINNVNDATKGIPRAAKALMRIWTSLKTTVGDLVDQLGGLDGALVHLGRAVTPLALVFAGLMAFKALAYLTTPIGLITGLATAIGLLYDDYTTWKEGGESFINWNEWKPEITAATEAVYGLRDALKSILGIDFANWTLKGELKGLADNFKELTEMGRQLANMLNALAAGDFTAAGKAGKALMTQGQDKPSATPGVEASANSAREAVFAPFQAIDDYVKGLFDKYLVAGGSGMGGNKQPAGVQMPPAGAPGAALPKTTTVNNNVTAPQTINVTNNITAAPGQDPAAIGNAVTNQMQFKLKDYGFDANSLVNAGGAK